MSEQEIFDLAIIGGGPAGLTASVYASRYKVKNIVLAELMGGMAFGASEVGNFPSQPDISGMELMQKMQDHAFKALDASQKMGTVKNINKKEDGTFEITMAPDVKILAKSVLISTGTTHSKLGVPGENELRGKGVAYCATCDAFFYRNLDVAVAGSGNVALTAALHLAKIAKQVYLIVRGNEFKGETVWADRVKETPNIKIMFNQSVKEIVGKDKVEKLILADDSELPVNGIFVSIGHKPVVDFTMNFDLAKDEQGHIKVAPDMRTNIDGVFAAGDVTDGSNYFKQIATAVGEGSIAANSVYKWLQIGQ
jgi:thioredoxin reductase (NADPH)